MPTPITIDGFLELGFKSGLLEKEAVQSCQSNWSRSGIEPKSPKELADALIKEGVLTHFQAEKLIAGRWRGFLIAGKYRLLERLGAGGMGAVYLCEHIKMGRKVALKILPVQQAEDLASLLSANDPLPAADQPQARSAGAAALQDGAILLTVFLRHDESKTVDQSTTT